MSFCNGRIFRKWHGFYFTYLQFLNCEKYETLKKKNNASSWFLKSFRVVQWVLSTNITCGYIPIAFLSTIFDEGNGPPCNPVSLNLSLPQKILKIRYSWRKNWINKSPVKFFCELPSWRLPENFLNIFTFKISKHIISIELYFSSPNYTAHRFPVTL